MSRLFELQTGNLRARFQAGAASIRSEIDRVRAVLTVGNVSGLMWELSLPGIVAIARAGTGAQSPSQIYRIHAANTPNKVALCWRDTRVTFAALNSGMDRLAGGLARHGVKRGSSVLLMMKNRPEFTEVNGGVGRLGASAVAVSWRSTPAELAFLATNSGASAIVFDHELAETVEAARKDLPIPSSSYFAVGGAARSFASYESLRDAGATYRSEVGAEEDAAVVIYTSGTTGKPKGAVRKFPKEALPAALRLIAETPMRTDDVHLVACPLYHSTAFGFLTFAHILGATAVVMDDFKAEAFLDAIERHSVTTTALVPTMLHRVLALGPEVLATKRTRSLRAIFAAGAPLPGPLATAAMEHFGDIVFNFYGSTETSLVTLAKPEDLRAAPSTIGKVLPGNEIRLLTDSGAEAKEGEVGELYVRSKLLVSGYHKDEQATQASMKEGFFSVGDLARRDRDGRYFIEGRKRDMVISGGVNVYPAEVEGVFEEHPEIAELAVIGVEDPEWGERVRAFVVRKPGSTLDEGTLRVWARERLSGAKVPRDIVFLDVLPRNPTGKVLRRELRDWLPPEP